jgi:hypothetical protein
MAEIAKDLDDSSKNDLISQCKNAVVKVQVQNIQLIAPIAAVIRIGEKDEVNKWVNEMLPLDKLEDLMKKLRESVDEDFQCRIKFNIFEK